MPSREQILHELTGIASRYTGVAIAWHVMLGAILVAALLGWRPSGRVAATVMLALLVCVSVLGVVAGNRFNGAAFLALALALAVPGWRAGTAPVTPGERWAVAVGLALVAFGWIYPHFLEGSPALAYLYAAPTGLVPCPTLAVVTGASLVLGGLGSRGWMLSLAGAGLFYGLFGMLRLGVWLDVGLLVGAVALILSSLRTGRVRPARTPHPVS
jgi:hypothetical protein